MSLPRCHGCAQINAPGIRCDCPVSRETPRAFTDLAGFRKAYDDVRGGILVAHGHDRDAKNVRLSPGLIVMDLYVADQWMLYSDSVPDMKDAIRARRGAVFRLRARFQEP